MHPHRNADAEPAPRRAAAPPLAGNVQGLGVVDALRIDLEPGQLPWLAAEIDVLRYCLEDELAHQRARYDELPQAAKDHHWPCARGRAGARAPRLPALGPGDDPRTGADYRRVGRGAVANPWDKPTQDDAPALERVEGPVAVVGPAALVTVLIRGATCNVADALGEALRGPSLDVDEHTDSSSGLARGRAAPRDARDRREAAHDGRAAQAFTDTYLDVLIDQGYSFDPEYEPVSADELE